MKTMRRFCSVILALALAFGLQTSAHAQVQYGVASTIGGTGEYDSNWIYWSQGASEYEAVRLYGCYIVALSKLMVEAGLKPSDQFTPDDCYTWACDGDYIDVGYRVKDPQKILADYTGGTVFGPKYEGDNRKKMPYDTANEKIMTLLRDGYYVILHLGGSSHYIYVHREKSLAQGETVVCNSQSDIYTSEKGKGFAPTTNLSLRLCSPLREMKNGIFKNRVVQIIAFSVEGAPGTSGNQTENPLAAVTTDRVEGLSGQEATLYGAVSSPGYVAEEIGMYIGTTPDERTLTRLGCDHPKGSSPIMWYSTRKYGYELQPGTTYYYQAYAVVEGKPYRGEILSFTTPQTGEASAENGESGVTDGGVYTLTPKCAPSACLDVDNGGKASKTNIQIYRSNGTASQKFKFAYVGNGYYTIEAMVSGKMLDVSGGKRDSKTNVWQYTSNGTIAQHWKLVDAGDGYYYLIPELNDDLALDVSGGGSKNKTNVWVYTRNQSDAQKWKLTPVS